MNREYWLDRVKGIACVIVFLNHFFLTFGYTCLGLNKIVVTRPFNVLVNGNYAVCLFLLISAYVISVPIYRQKNFEKIQQTIFKRYPRLMLPVFFSSLFAYILDTLWGYANQEAAVRMGNAWLQGKYGTPLTFKELLMTSFVKVWWNGDASFNAPFWMLRILFFGTFLTVIITMMTAVQKRYAVVVLIAMGLLYTYQSSYYLCFILGILLAYLKCKTDIWKRYKGNRVFLGINVILLIISIYLPGYAGVIGQKVAKLAPEHAFICNGTFYNILGSFLLVFSLMGMERVKNCLEKSKIMAFVSKISFSIYLIHWPIICSFSCFLYLKLQERGYVANIMYTIIFLLTVIIVAIVAKIFNELVEKRICDKVVAKICKNYFKESV